MGEGGGGGEDGETGRRCDGKGRMAEKRDLGMIGTRAIENPAPR